MSANVLQLNDYGTTITRTLYDESGQPIDLTDHTAITFTFVKPDAAVLETEGTVLGDDEDGVVQYTFAEGELSVAGEWQVQVYIELPSGAWRTNITKFTVAENLTA